MLTTIDNPYNPYKDYKLWWDWDRRHLYNTAEYLAFVDGYAEGIQTTDVEAEDSIEESIDWILANDDLHIYARISPTDHTPLSQEAFEAEMKRFESA